MKPRKQMKKIFFNIFLLPLILWQMSLGVTLASVNPFNRIDRQTYHRSLELVQRDPFFKAIKHRFTESPFKKGFWQGLGNHSWASLKRLFSKSGKESFFEISKWLPYLSIWAQFRKLHHERKSHGHLSDYRSWRRNPMHDQFGAGGASRLGQRAPDECLVATPEAEVDPLHEIMGAMIKETKRAMVSAGIQGGLDVASSATAGVLAGTETVVVQLQAQSWGFVLDRISQTITGSVVGTSAAALKTAGHVVSSKIIDLHNEAIDWTREEILALVIYLARPLDQLEIPSPILNLKKALIGDLEVTADLTGSKTEEERALFKWIDKKGTKKKKGYGLLVEDEEIPEVVAQCLERTPPLRLLLLASGQHKQDWKLWQQLAFKRAQKHPGFKEEEKRSLLMHVD